MAKKWIQEAIKKPGSLHKDLGIPEGKKIPAKKLKKAEKSKDPTIRKRAILAETLKRFKKKQENSDMSKESCINLSKKVSMIYQKLKPFIIESNLKTLQILSSALTKSGDEKKC